MISGSRGAPGSPDAPHRLGPLDVLVLSTWCGLAAGELEVGARIAHAALSSTNQLYVMTRHFIWLVPLIDLALFLGFGAILAMATRLWPRRAGWLSPRLILTWAILPVLAEAGRQIHLEAWLILAMGIATGLSPMLERDAVGWRRRLALGVPILAGLVLLQAGWILASDRIQRRREEGRPLPSSDAPNVLLVVLDTVRADHLGLYGYTRPTSPNLDRLAAGGIRFDRARAAAPWTLASHANMFTGRWPHELGTGWMHPLRSDVPTLAEYLGSLGYATAGFVGNTFYCSYDSGLNRGFTHYEDYVLDTLTAIRTVHLIDQGLKLVAPLASSLSMGGRTSRQLTHGDRKVAREVDREFLDWLTRRPEPRRPFFAFLNFADAHTPYVLPSGEEYRFGSAPNSEADLMFLLEMWPRVDKRKVNASARALARDSYDNCIAYIDDRLGELFIELHRRGVLDHTLIIVAGDHGEGLGEHDLFDHGESLYRTEIRVPLVVVPPGGRGPCPAVVEPFVSLRDIPATIADVVRPGTEPPFPGRSLMRFCRETPSAPDDVPGDVAVLSELASPNPTDPNQGRSPAYRGPLISLADGDQVYIRNEGDGTEELYNDRQDPYELINRAGDVAMLPVLQRFRDRLPRSNVPPPAAKPGGPGGLRR